MDERKAAGQSKGEGGSDMAGGCQEAEEEWIQEMSGISRTRFDDRW